MSAQACGGIRSQDHSYHTFTHGCSAIFCTQPLTLNPTHKDRLGSASHVYRQGAAQHGAGQQLSRGTTVTRYSSPTPPASFQIRSRIPRLQQQHSGQIAARRSTQTQQDKPKREQRAADETASLSKQQQQRQRTAARTVKHGTPRQQSTTHKSSTGSPSNKLNAAACRSRPGFGRRTARDAGGWRRRADSTVCARGGRAAVACESLAVGAVGSTCMQPPGQQLELHSSTCCRHAVDPGQQADVDTGTIQVLVVIRAGRAL